MTEPKGLILSCDKDYISLLNHLFGKKEWTKEELRKAGHAMHLTTSDRERGYKLQEIFGEIKCKECKEVADSYKPKNYVKRR